MGDTSATITVRSLMPSVMALCLAAGATPQAAGTTDPARVGDTSRSRQAARSRRTTRPARKSDAAEPESATGVRAVIWIADDPEWKRHAERCADYCTRLGYEVIAVVAAHAGGTWADVVKLVLRDGRAEVCVVAARDQLPRDRTPRIEAVADERRHLAPLPGSWNQRTVIRPQFLRR